MHRSFVVQLSADYLPGKTFVGRVEHVRSGEAIKFRGVEEFLAFLSRSVEAEMQKDAREGEEARVTDIA